ASLLRAGSRVRPPRADAGGAAGRGDAVRGQRVGGASETALQVMLPEDRSGFVRRQCRWCKRCFKLRPGAEDGEVVRRWAARMIPERQDADPVDLEALRCPYCGQGGTREDWLTGPHRVGIERFAGRLRTTVTYTALHQLVDGAFQGARPTVVPVVPEMLTGVLGVEPDDLRVVALVCCDLEVKVSADWPGSLHCPDCGVEHQRPVKSGDVKLTFIPE